MEKAKLITEEEFLKALEICRKYNVQLETEFDLTIDKSKTLLKDFYEKNKHNGYFNSSVKTRLLGVLRNIYLDEPLVYIEDVSEKRILEMKNASKHTAMAFAAMKKYFKVK